MKQRPSTARTRDRPRARVARARLEREAGRAAACAGRGSRVAPSELSATEPARPLGGTGAPLPASLRERLERVFSADLAAVRVHADADRAEGERALTAGTHVYLAADESPTAPASFPMLAHEVAHVLQQTGEARDDGCVVARERSGAGPPLAWEAPFPATPSVLSVDVLLEAWSQTAETRNHRTAKAHIDALRESLAADPDPALFWSARASAVLNNERDEALALPGERSPRLGNLPALARAALFDGLKRSGQTEAAVHILRYYDQTESYLRDPAVYVAYVERVGVDRLLDRIIELWQTLPLLESARPEKAMELSARWLLGEFDEVPQLPIHESSNPRRRTFVATDLPRLVDEALTAGRLVPNELVMSALIAIYGLEMSRIAVLQPVQGAQRVVSGNPRIDQRAYIAGHLVRWSAEVARRAPAIRAGSDRTLSGPAETRHLLVRNLAPALGALGQFALDFWQRGGAVVRLATRQTVDPALARGLDAATLRGIPAAFPALDPAIARGARAFFARESNGSLPAPAVYQARVATFRADLATLEQDMRSQAIERIRPAWASGLAFDASAVPDAPAELARMGWVIARLRDLGDKLAAYGRADDEAYARTWGPQATAVNVTSWPADDVRVIHRGGFAIALHGDATRAALAETAAITGPVVSATESWAAGQQQEDVLAIAGPFRPEPATDIARLAQDQGTNPIQGWEQFTVEQVILFFQADHYRRTSERITTLLSGPEGSRFELNQVPIINQAHDAERASPERPLRHTVGRDRYIYLERGAPPALAGRQTAPSGPQPASRASLRALVEAHPISRVTVHNWPTYIFPSNQGRPDLVVWRLPNPVRLARFLRQVPEVNELLAGYAFLSLTPPDVAPTARQLGPSGSVSDADWWALWTDMTEDPLLGAEGLERRQEMRAALLDRRALARILRDERSRAVDDLQAREREAIVHERERVVRTRIEPLLRAHDARARAVESTRVNRRRVFLRDAATIAVEELERYLVFRIDDPAERDAHQAAAVLRVAFLLRDELVTRDGGEWVMRGWDRDVAYWWVPLLEDVMDRADDPSPALDLWLRADERPASSWVPARLEALENVYDAMIAALVAHQTEFGFHGIRGDGTIENPGSVHEVGSSRPWGAGEPFTIDGVTWEVMEVIANFTYHPAVVRRDGRQIVPPILKLGSRVVGFDGSIELLRVDRDGDDVLVRNDAAGELVLRPLAYAVMMATTVRQLLELADTIETGMMLLVDLAELIPGAGQAAAVARIMGGVMRVSNELSDPESEGRQLLDALLTDPGAVIDRIWEAIQGNFPLTPLVEALLYHPALEALERLENIRPARRPRPISSRVGRILRRLGAIGRGVAGSLGRVIDRTHDIRDDLQAIVLERPALGRALDVIADYLRFLATVPVDPAALGTLPGDVRDTVRDKFVELMNMVASIRLPERIITLDQVLDLLVELIARRLGGKYRIGFMVVRAILEAAGEWQTVIRTLSGAVRRAIGDPTDYINAWPAFVQGHLEPHLERAQEMLHGVLAPIYGALPGVTEPLPRPEPVDLTLAGEHFLDAQPQLRPGAVRVPLAEPIELTGGRELTDRERTQFEHQLGQDLSHVRVHTGQAAARATRAAGARALTSGSHVLLAADVRPEGESGRRVLRHELVHVLQQTGPRPPGEADARPATGEPRLGLRFDPAAEAVADAIADREGEAEVPAAGGQGVQPDLAGIGQRFIDYLLHTERAREEVRRIDATRDRAGQLIGRDVRADVAHVGRAIVTWIGRFTRNHIRRDRRDMFESATRDIKAWLQSRETQIRNAIEDLAVDASDAARRREDARESPVMELREESFERKLQRYIAVATGCSLDIELNLNRRRLVRAAPLRSAQLVNVNLALIPDEGAGQRLWNLMMRNTFSGAARTSRDVRAHARILLFAAGVGDEVWDATGFKLTDRLKRQIQREAPRTTALTLPTAADFWHGATRPSGLAEDQPALWIGRHGHPVTHHGQPDRQSHHTTQYLLVQYFEQHHRLKPFPDLTVPALADLFRTQLGFHVARGKVLSVGSIAVGRLDPSSGRRGSEMPAILLSAVAHRRGRLHIAPFVAESPSDDPDSELTPETQAGQVHDWFRTGLEQRLPGRLATEYWDAVNPAAGQEGEALDWLRANSSVLRTAIPGAMQYTYAQMRAVMLDRIEPALRYLEVTWYQELVAARTISDADRPAYRVTSSLVSRVADAARANNRQIMEVESGWA